MDKDKILVVDDETLVFESIEHTLGDEYQLYHAENGAVGLKLYEELRPILIILDVRMPVMDGFEFLKRIGISPEDSYSVIVLSGHTVGMDVRTCYNMGVTTFLRKPLDIFELRGLVKQCISTKKQYQSLCYEKDFARSIIDYSVSTIIAVDSNRRIKEFNKSAEHMYGYSADEVIGKPVSMIYGDNEASNQVKEAMLTKGCFSGEIISKRKNGEEFPALIFATVLRNNEGKIIGSVGSSQDLTKERQAEADRHDKEVAQRANQTKSEFMANMSHEIRTPMNAIIGLSQLTMATDLTAKQHDYLTKIQSSANNLLNIINDILDFSKIDAGKLVIESIPFRLETVLTDVSNMLSNKIEEKGLEFFINCAQEIPTELQGDPLRLGQILINLCNNAIKFTGRGGYIIVTVVIEEKTAEKMQLRFSVRDTGIGITPEQLEKLFKPFSQADSSTTRKYGGTGLGLTICKRIVELMDGNIWLESTLGFGSIFYFTAAFTLASGKETQRTMLPETLQNMQVLVIAANAIARETLANILHDLALKPVLASSSAEALAQLEAAETNKKPYPLVLTDLHMADINAVEILKAVPTKAREPKKIIMVTATDQEEIMQQAQKVGINAFLVKPISSAKLLNAILEAFGKRNSNASYQQEMPKATHLLKNIVGARILLVEDNAINQQVAQELLESAKFVVEIANNGLEAVQMVEHSPYDVVLMDVQMPEMDGYAATSKIRSNPRLDKLPIIAMTAHAMDTNRDKCLAIGMNDFVTKPIDINQLFATLAKWIKPDTRNVPTCVLTEKNPIDAENTAPIVDLPGINVKSGLQRLGSNRNLFRKLWTNFRQDYAGATQEIKSLLAQTSDLESANRLVHSIKGVAGNLGATELFKMARELETAIKQNNAASWSERLVGFEKALQQVLESVDSLELADQQLAEDCEPAAALNLEEVTLLLIELTNLLKTNDAKSEQAVIVLKTLLKGMAVHNEAQQLETCIDQFDFINAQTYVTTIAQALHISLETTP